MVVGAVRLWVDVLDPCLHTYCAAVDQRFGLSAQPIGLGEAAVLSHRGFAVRLRRGRSCRQLAELVGILVEHPEHVLLVLGEVVWTST